MGRITVYLADDHPVFVAGITRIIEEDAELELVGTASDGRRALAEILAHEPDVAILDIGMPETSGLQVVAALKEVNSRTRIIVLTGTESPRAITKAVEDGVSGYVLKTVNWTDLVVAIKKVAQGERVFTKELEEIVHARLPNLSKREREVLECLAKNLSVAKISTKLGIEVPTVRSHLRRIYTKLNVSSQAAAVAEAMRHDLIE